MPNHERTEQSSREELQAISAAWERAMVANDAVAIGQFMTSDWLIVSATGVIKRDDFLALVAPGDLTHENFKGEITSIQIYGETAVITGRVKNNGAYKGQPFTSDEWTSDVFIKRDGQWKCVHSHITAARG